jgi:hypothetical protein
MKRRINLQSVDHSPLYEGAMGKLHISSKDTGPDLSNNAITKGYLGKGIHPVNLDCAT